MTLTGWIIYNGFLASDKFLDYAQMLRDAGIKQGHDVTIYKNNDILNILNNTQSLTSDCSFPDYVIFTDKDIYLARTLENLNIPVFNCAKTIEISDDKIKTYQKLSYHNIPIPKTIIAPKTFGISHSFDQTFLDDIIDLLSYPFIIKEAFGSFGEQVYLIHDDNELSETLKQTNEPFMFQEFIKTSYGRDVRIQVVGQEVVAAMKRVAEHDFRANVTGGGQMIPYEPNAEEMNLAIQASLAIGADFSGVDLLFGENERPIVCEVNSNAHIRNLLDCTQINVANDIVRHIEEQVIK